MFNQATEMGQAVGMPTRSPFQFNPFMSQVPPGAQSFGGGSPPIMPQAPQMPQLPPQSAMPAMQPPTPMPPQALAAQAGGAMGHIPPGLLGALLHLSQRNPAMFDQRMAGPLPQHFGITPDMVQNFQPLHGNFGMQKLPTGGGMGGGQDAAFAAQSGLGMDNGRAKNQNIGSTY